MEARKTIPALAMIMAAIVLAGALLMSGRGVEAAGRAGALAPAPANAEAGGRWSEGSLDRVCMDLIFTVICVGHDNPPPPPPPPPQPKWCVARPDTSPDDLVEMEEEACGAGADCFFVSEQGPCHEPNTVLAHVSWAVNSYFFKHLGPCDFKGHAMLVSSDPSPSTITDPVCRYPSTNQ